MNVAAKKLAAGAIAAFSCISVGFADTLTWTGAVDANWSNAANWSTDGGNATPQNGDAVVLSGSSVNDLGSADAPLELAALTCSGATSLTGNPLRFPAAGSVAVAAVAWSGGAFTCGVKLECTSASGWFNLKGANASALVLNGDLVCTGGAVVFLYLFGDANVVNGALDLGANGRIEAQLNDGACVYNGVVTCKKFGSGNGFDGCWGTTSQGLHTFCNANNKIGTVEEWRSCVKCGVKDAVKDAAVYLGYTFFSGRSACDFFLNGFDQEINRFTCPAPKNAWSVKTDLRKGATTGGRIVATGKERLTLKATANCLFVGKIEGDLGLVWAPQGDYTFVVSNRTQACAQPIVVSAGTFAAEGGVVEGETPVTFPNLTGFEVAAGATVRIGTASPLAFPKVTTLDVTGRLEVTGDAVSPFNAGKVVATLAAGAKLSFPAGMTCVFKSVSVDGEAVPMGWYSGSAASARATQASWLEGDGEVFVTETPGMEIATATWDAGGADENVSTAANWEGDETPDLASGTTLAVFGDAGENAVADGTVTLNGVRTACTEGGFTLAAAEGGSYRVQNGGISSAYETRQPILFKISAPLELYASQTWAPYCTMLVTGAFSAATDGIDLTIDDGGWSGIQGDANTFPGKVTMVRGTLALIGSSPLGESDQKLWVECDEAMTKKPNVELNNATVRRPVYVLRGDYTYPWPIYTVAGTTNAITGAFTTSGLCRIRVEDGALVFAGGFETGGLFDPNCAENGWIVIRDVPTANAWLYVDGACNLALEVPGNKFSDSIFLTPQNDDGFFHLETRVANALAANCLMPMGVKTDGGRTKNRCSWDLCGLDQQCGGLTGNGVRTTVFTDAPATLTVNQATAKTNAIYFAGAVSLVKNGAKELAFTGTSTATGAVTVAEGTLRFKTGAAWASGTRHAADFSVADGACLALEEGVFIRGRRLYLPDGNGGWAQQKLGTWGSSASTAKYKNDAYFSGAGVFKAEGERDGTVLIVR